MDDRERTVTDPEERLPGESAGVPPREARDTRDTSVVVDNRGAGTWVWVAVVAVVVLVILWLTGVIGGGAVTPADEGPVVPVEDQVAPADPQDDAVDVEPGAVDPVGEDAPPAIDPADDGLGNEQLDDAD